VGTNERERKNRGKKRKEKKNESLKHTGATSPLCSTIKRSPCIKNFNGFKEGHHRISEKTTRTSPIQRHSSHANVCVTMLDIFFLFV